MVCYMQNKIYEDYEPISNIGVCSALLIVLGTCKSFKYFRNEKNIGAIYESFHNYKKQKQNRCFKYS